MGPVTSKKQPTPNQQLQMIHPRFKQARFIQQHQQIEISLPFLDDKEVKQWQQKLKKYLKEECLLLPTSYESNKVGLCGNNGVCNVRFQNYPYVLKDQINDRIANNLQTFENKEIWYILFIVLEAASTFHQNNMKLGDVRPINIFISDNGQTKVANQLSFPNQNPNYQKSFFQKEITYIAPEEMKHLLFKSQSKQNIVLAESFSIGLTMIDAVTLSNSEDIYNLNNFRIDYEKLEERKERVRNSGSLDRILKDIILGLAAVNPEERLNSDEVFKWLRVFREQILNFEQFEIVQWPFSNHQESGKEEQQIQQISILSFNNQAVEPIPASSSYRAPITLIDNRVQTKFSSSAAAGSSLPCYELPTSSLLSYRPSNIQITSTLFAERGDIGGYDQMRLRLQKIDEQLARSRQLFPS